MDGIKSVFRKIKYKLRHDFFSVENIVLIVAIALCLIWIYQSILAVTRNWKLQETLLSERKKLELITVEVEALEFENEYYKTEEYQELLARKYLDKKLEGENLVILPENSEMAKHKHDDVVIVMNETSQSNFEKWIKYLFPSN